MKYLIVLIAIILSGQTLAECIRFEKSKKESNEVPGYDGIGAFGPLHMTLNLGCLELLKVSIIEEEPVATVRDEKGKLYLVGPGDYMGEDHGVVEEIRNNELVIRQLLYTEGKWVEKYVIFSKKRIDPGLAT